MRRVLPIALMSLAFVAAGTLSLLRAAEDKKLTIGEIMKKTNNKGALRDKVADGKASDAEKKELVELYTQVGKLDPPKGDKESWKKLTEELVKNGKALVEGKKEAAATLQKSCGACHSKHKKA